VLFRYLGPRVHWGTLGMRWLFALIWVVSLAGCNTAQEGASQRAAKMEMEDDSSCQRLSAGKGAQAYSACRQNLMVYRQEVAREDIREQERSDRVAAALQGMGSSLSNIGK